MTPKDKVFRRLRGESVDKIPNLNILMTWKNQEIVNLYGRKRQIYRLFS
ncbi:MAG: hypothetical protein ACYCXB_02505 [Candidatus Humimicrobiaceae bacterium]